MPKAIVTTRPFIPALLTALALLSQAGIAHADSVRADTVYADAVQAGASRAETGRVLLLKTPDGGIQPQAAVDARGGLHLIYFKGDPMAGDLWYVHREAGAAAFSAPLRVNSVPGSAIATGTIRGAALALGTGDRVHVVWNGSNAAPRGPGGLPMLYTRLNDEGTAFLPQRNLITWAGGIDGGGTIAADSAGNVFVFWHALAGANDESGAAVFLTRSTDGGRTFAREQKVNPLPTGACGCCGMKAMVAADGTLYVLYRAAAENRDRDTVLLVSADKGATFVGRTLDKWQLTACPMTSYALVQASATRPVLGAWKTRERIYFASLPRSAAPAGAGNSTLASALNPISPAGLGNNPGAPVLAQNTSGQTLLAWTEGTAWAKGGSLAWQLFDQDFEPIGAPSRAPGVPTWGSLSAIATPDGNFILLY